MRGDFCKILIFSGLCLVGLGACKSDFEKIRTSGDPAVLSKAAYDYYEQEEYFKAQTLLEQVIPLYRGQKELEDIYYKYAYTFYHLNKFILANYYFKNFAQTFPSSDLKEESEFMAAYSSYELSPNYRLDQTYTQQAIDEFQIFVNAYPNSERIGEINTLIDGMRRKQEKKAFESAKLYLDLKQYQAATTSFENLLKDFPETTNAREVRYLIAKSHYDLASNSIFTKQEERFRDAQEAAEIFVNKYPDGAHYNEVREILERSRQQLNSITNDGYQSQSTGLRR